MTPTNATDLCVQRTSSNGWHVVLCTGRKAGQVLGTFTTFAAAADFALQERDRRQATDDPVNRIHFPDDCPCYRSEGCADEPCEPQH